MNDVKEKYMLPNLLKWDCIRESFYCTLQSKIKFSNQKTGLKNLLLMPIFLQMTYVLFHKKGNVFINLNNNSENNQKSVSLSVPIRS